MQADVEDGYGYSDEYRASGESGEVVVGVGVYHVVKADGEGLFLRAGEYHAREDEVHPRGYELRERYEDENGFMSGSTICVKMRRLEAPSSFAASSRLRGMLAR